MSAPAPPSPVETTITSSPSPPDAPAPGAVTRSAPSPSVSPPTTGAEQAAVFASMRWQPGPGSTGAPASSRTYRPIPSRETVTSFASPGDAVKIIRSGGHIM
jgi:hypothetical protein